MRLYLTGLPNTGKSSVGKALSEKLSLPLFDTDHLIESASGITCRTFFIQEGETSFRALEEKIVRQTTERAGIIALGGGAMAPPNERVICLKGSSELLWSRFTTPPPYAPTFESFVALTRKRCYPHTYSIDIEGKSIDTITLEILYGEQ